MSIPWSEGLDPVNDQGVLYSRCNIQGHASDEYHTNNAAVSTMECDQWVYDTGEFDLTFVTQVHANLQLSLFNDSMIN